MLNRRGDQISPRRADARNASKTKKGARFLVARPLVPPLYLTFQQPHLLSSTSLLLWKTLLVSAFESAERSTSRWRSCLLPQVLVTRPVAEVVITPAHRPRPSTIVAQPSAPPSRHASSSTSFSPIEQSSSFSSSSHLAPPSSRSVPDFSSNSLRLEVSLLRSRLKATEQLLQREQLRARQEIVTLQEQFATERQAYMEYIERLQGGTGVD